MESDVDEGVGKDFRGRMGRSAFAIRYVISLLLSFGLGILLRFSGQMFVIWGCVIGSFGLLYWYLTFAVKRGHDFNADGSKSGWLAVLPLVNLYWIPVLLFRRGDAYANRFGSASSSPETSPVEDVGEQTDADPHSPPTLSSLEARLAELKKLSEAGYLSEAAYIQAQLEVLKAR